MSNVDCKCGNGEYGWQCQSCYPPSEFVLLTGEELKEFNKQSRKMEQELTKAHTAGLFLTAADLRE